MTGRSVVAGALARWLLRVRGKDGGVDLGPVGCPDRTENSSIHISVIADDSVSDILQITIR